MRDQQWGRFTNRPYPHIDGVTTPGRPARDQRWGRFTNRPYPHIDGVTTPGRPVRDQGSQRYSRYGVGGLVIARRPSGSAWVAGAARRAASRARSELLRV